MVLNAECSSQVEGILQKLHQILDAVVTCSSDPLQHNMNARCFLCCVLSAQVDDYQNTNVEGVYAVGDACDKKVGFAPA